jgi:hypothetical protein
MNLNKQINLLASLDPLIKYKQLEYFIAPKDRFHIIRNQQQRGITTNMILIALNYGAKKHSYQDVSYSITDRILLRSVYEKYLSKLRGLTIVGNWNETKDTFILITCFWNYTIKSRKRY